MRENTLKRQLYAGKPAFGVQREDSCAVKRAAHRFSSPPLGLIKTLDAAFLSHFFLRFPTLFEKRGRGQANRGIFFGPTKTYGKYNTRADRWPENT
jgi:hypothetical protein